MKLSTAPLPSVESTPLAWRSDDIKRTLAASMTGVIEATSARVRVPLESDSATRNELHQQHDERDHQEQVHEPTQVQHEAAERPQDQQDEDDRPEHLQAPPS